MKKLFTLLAVLAASATIANAQIGIVAGVTSTTTEINTEDIAANMEGINLYHVGVAAHIGLPFGFAVQPELLYQMKGADLSQTVNNVSTGAEVETSSFETKNGYAELGLGLQWGLDLVAFRPFVFAKPFVGYQLTEADSFDGNTATTIIEKGTDSSFQEYLSNAKEKLEYGFSLGVGVDLLEHFQLSFEYFKNLGNMFNQGEFDTDSAKAKVLEGYDDLSSYGGFKLTLGFFF